MEVIDKPQSLVAEYQPFYAQLAQLEQDNASLVFDYETPKGNKEARSHIFALRQTRGALERTRKAAKDESLQKGRAIDAEAKTIDSRIEAMISVHQAEIDKIEQREKDRVAGLQFRLSDLKAQVNGTAEDIRARISDIEAVAIDDSWQEFTTEAAKAKDANLAQHREWLAAREKADAEAAELARLRAEAAERDRKEREAQIAREAEERAKAEAERQAKAAREAAERRELELKLQAEAAERRRIEAEQKAERDAKEAAERAERDKAAAVKAEQDRAAAAARAEAVAAAKREANKAHKRRINNAALEALVAGGIDSEAAKAVITLIAEGKVPAVSISY